MKMHVRLTLIEDALGMMPGDEDILKTHLASKAPTPEKTEEEVAWCAETEEEKRITVFPRTDDGRPMFWDYQIKGMLKDSCSALARQGKHGSPDGVECAKIKAYKGPRTSIAKSEAVPEGSTLDFTFELAYPELRGMVVECLNYGRLRGLGQWRNSSKGRYLWEELDESGNVIGGNLHDEI